MDQKIMQVVRTVRQGVSKKTNKPYEILLVMVENGDEVEVFGPAKQGDIVTDITFNEQYNKTQGRVVKPDKNEEVSRKLDVIYDEVKEIKVEVTTLGVMLDKISGSQRPAAGSVPTPYPATDRTKPDPRPSSAVRQPAQNPRQSTELDQKLERWKKPPQPETEPFPSDEDIPFIDNADEWPSEDYGDSSHGR